MTVTLPTAEGWTCHLPFNYCILNFINKRIVEIYFLLCRHNIGLLLGPQSRKYLLSNPLQKKFASH